MKITQAWQTAIVTGLMMSSCGDLILDGRGDLCRRQPWNADYTRELAWAEHRIGEKLAIITREGWTLTTDGVEYILANEIFEPKDKKRLVDLRTSLLAAEKYLAQVQIENDAIFALRA